MKGCERPERSWDAKFGEINHLIDRAERGVLTHSEARILRRYVWDLYNKIKD